MGSVLCPGCGNRKRRPVATICRELRGISVAAEHIAILENPSAERAELVGWAKAIIDLFVTSCTYELESGYCVWCAHHADPARREAFNRSLEATHG